MGGNFLLQNLLECGRVHKMIIAKWMVAHVTRFCGAGGSLSFFGLFGGGGSTGKGDGGGGRGGIGVNVPGDLMSGTAETCSASVGLEGNVALLGGGCGGTWLYGG